MAVTTLGNAEFSDSEYEVEGAKHTQVKNPEIMLFQH